MKRNPSYSKLLSLPKGFRFVVGFPLRHTFAVFLSAIILTACAGCTASDFPQVTEDCKYWTYINVGWLDYLKARYNSQPFVRIAIIPFDVQENFAPPGNESLHYGRELARRFQSELQRTQELSIIEVFNQDRWPGKREEFFLGNHRAIQLARDAGYDFVIVGYLDELRNAEEMILFSKVIDTSNGVSVWYGKTMVFSRRRALRDLLADARLADARPELFHFPERAAELASCTVDGILYFEPPVGGVEERRGILF